MKRIHVALTFDVEQWDSRSRASAHAALIDALESTPTTWFVAEDRSQSFCGRYPDSARRVLSSGHELAAHVHFRQAAFEAMALDVRAATTTLRDAGSACVSFRGGAHVFSNRLAEEIVALGYRFDSSAVPGLVRRYHTAGGDTFAAYPHVWSARPFWWRPGLLELPTASFPVTQPLAFLRKRFRLPMLVDQPRVFRERLCELADAYPADDVPVVMLGHSFDLERAGDPDPHALARLGAALVELRADPAIRWCTVERLGEDIAAGRIDVGVRASPSALTTAAAVAFTEHITRLAEHPWVQRVRQRLFHR